MLTVEVMDDFAAFPTLREEWNAVAKDSYATIYQTYEWLSLWWKHIGSAGNRTLHVLLVRDGPTLVGVAPFFLESMRLFGSRGYAHLGLLGSGSAFNRSSGMFLDDGPSDYLDILARSAYARAVAQELAGYFREHADLFDEIEFLNASPSSVVRTVLVPALENAGFACTTTDADICPHLTLATSVAEYLKTLDASVRRRFSQAQKAAEERTLFSVESPMSRADADEALTALMMLHQRRWRKLGYPGLFASPAFTAFQSAAAHTFLENGWLRLKRAVSADATVAARLAFAYEGRLYDYLSGFDDEAPAAKRRPGIALLLSLMDDAVNQGIRSIDFLRGDEGYKFELTREVRRNANILVVPTADRSAARRRAMRIVRFRAYLRFLLAREWGLLRVQLQEHRFPASLYHFAAFRAQRLVRKLRAGTHPTAPGP